MKKKKYFIRAIVSLLLLLSIYVLNYNSINKKISRDLGVHIPNSVKIKYEDSHGGFLGDGMTSAEANLNKKQIDKIVDKSEGKWSKTPIPSEIKKLASVKYAERGHNNLETYKIENCYWIFKNRTPEGRFAHITRNYSVAIIDLDTNILYYISFDS